MYQTSFPIGYSLIVALTGFPVKGCIVIISLAGLPIGYSVIIVLFVFSRVLQKEYWNDAHMFG